MPKCFKKSKRSWALFAQIRAKMNFLRKKGSASF